MDKQTYAGHFIDEDGEDMSFNLYGFENIDFEDTKENILNNLKERHFSKLKDLFHMCGLELHELQYWSPKAYNFAGDTIDLVLSISDKSLLEFYILTNRVHIQKMLDQNKSYDGYMALTSNSIDEILEKLKDDDLDIMVVIHILLKYPLDRYRDFYDLHISECDEE